MKILCLHGRGSNNEVTKLVHFELCIKKVLTSRTRSSSFRPLHFAPSSKISNLSMSKARYHTQKVKLFTAICFLLHRKVD